MNRIGVLTSGGDAPGMNACIRAVVRTAIFQQMEVTGIERGYQGMIENSMIPLNLRSVGGIINRGGTILHSARSSEFRTREGREKAVQNLRQAGVEGLIVIGGDGSLRGAQALSTEWDIPTIGIPASIDNDISGTDHSIGFDTAANTGLDAIDKIRDTADSHDRIFVIEVMGRSNGFLALAVGLAGGAEAIIIPEIPYSIEKIADRIRQGYARGKRSDIIVVAEGAASAADFATELREATGFETRETVLGHLQRGGSPTVDDRIYASRMGAAAVELIKDGKRNLMVGVLGEEIVSCPIQTAWESARQIDTEQYRLAEVLSI